MTIKRTLAAVAASVAFAAVVLAQTPESKQSGSPTSNEYRIRVIEPAEGATIQGNEFNLVLSSPDFPSGTSVSQAERRDATRPVFQLWIDGKDLGNVPNDQNVFAVRADSFGAHKLVVAAKNAAGQVIGRKEISFTTADSSASSTTATTMSTASESESRATEAPAPAPAPVASTTDSNASARETTTSASSTLPATGSSYPAAALAGLALVGSGFLLRRRS